MAVSLSVAWKLALAGGLAAAIFVSVRARAPRQMVPVAELRRLVLCALILYLVGALATLTHHAGLAGLLYGAGIMVSALAAWLSRGRDREDPPDGEGLTDGPLPPEPDGLPELDWSTFERDFREYAARLHDLS
jgi:hypothetical protein